MHDLDKEASMANATELEIPTTMLGRGGPVVSRLALGTMTFGVESDEETAHAQLDLFTAAGGTFIDTADAYAAGESERMIGRWVEKRGGHDDLIVATKGRFAPPAGSSGASRRGLRIAAERSRERLQLDAIDLYFVHGWDKDVPVEETLEALADLVSRGVVHHVAWSNVTAWQLQKIVATADARKLPRPVALQPQYNLLDRAIEIEIMPCCIDEGISLTPWSPLGGGWLTGKYSAKAKPEGATRLGENPARGVEAYDLRNNDTTHRILNVVREIAAAHGRPMSHVALAWLLQRPGVRSVLLGARTAEQLEDNLGAAGFTLSDDEMTALTAVSAPDLPPYPYAMLEEYTGLSVWKELGVAQAT
jgi:aryl-alcohol dehydrogenase-like predicted oxidoreductase